MVDDYSDKGMTCTVMVIAFVMTEAHTFFRIKEFQV